MKPQKGNLKRIGAKKKKKEKEVRVSQALFTKSTSFIDLKSLYHATFLFQLFLFI